MWKLWIKDLTIVLSARKRTTYYNMTFSSKVMFFVGIPEVADPLYQLTLFQNPLGVLQVYIFMILVHV